MNNFTDFINTNSNAKWEEYVKGFISFSKEIFLTYEDFGHILNKLVSHPGSKIIGLNIDIKAEENDHPFYSYKFQNESTTAESFDKDVLDQHNWFKFEYSIWYEKNVQRDGTKKDEVKTMIRELVISFWKSNLRDEKTRTWTKILPETDGLINRTLSYYKDKCSYISFLYSDLDKFKVLNDKHGGQAANDLLLQMGSNFSDFIVDKPAILIRDKGDEFIILAFTLFIEDALSIAYDFQKILKKTTFTVTTSKGKVNLETKITAGINIRYTKTNDDISLIKEIGHSEEAMKTNGVKNYGTANLFNSGKQDLANIKLDAFSAKVSKLNIKLSSSNRPFRNVWLNFITSCVEHLTDPKSGLAELTEIIEWIKPQFGPICSTYYEFTTQPDYSKAFSEFDMLIAILKGIILNKKTSADQKKYSIKPLKDNKLAILQGRTELFSIGCNEKIGIDIGSFFQNIPTPVALLVKIGHSELALPEAIFGDIIVVDDRPTKGGGLPDFWELALAKVVNQINADPNLKRVYIIGEQKNGANTVNWLKKISDGAISTQDVETIIYKISTNNTYLNATRERLKNAVESFDNNISLIDSYAEFVTEGYSFKILEKEAPREKPLLFLQKDVKIDQYALSMEDGFKVKTLSEAYPLMLEIARLASNKNKNIRDQARGLLGELIDFKVELANPTKDLIPYYFREDSKKFDEYFNSLFINKEGLFAKHLSLQLELVLDHLEESITVSRKQYSTRRAILIIPNDQSLGELKPLGLVSLRIIPRFEGEHSVALVFSYTWRTVEAIVGFPYSVYGSIKYGEYIQQLLQKRVEGSGLKINFDKVSYIANSLHIFMDEQGQAIAKSIINDASI